MTMKPMGLQDESERLLAERRAAADQTLAHGRASKERADELISEFIPIALAREDPLPVGMRRYLFDGEPGSYVNYWWVPTEFKGWLLKSGVTILTDGRVIDHGDLCFPTRSKGEWERWRPFKAKPPSTGGIGIARVKGRSAPFSVHWVDWTVYHNEGSPIPSLRGDPLDQMLIQWLAMHPG